MKATVAWALRDGNVILFVCSSVSRLKGVLMAAGAYRVGYSSGIDVH